MSKNPSLSELQERIAEVTAGPPQELVEAVARALQEHRNSPIEVQARAAIAAMGEAGSWQLATAPTAAATASRRAMLDSTLLDFGREVEETGILKPKP